ncbi:MAG: S8 family serine peptidase [Thermoleophilia bacterium]
MRRPALAVGAAAALLGAAAVAQARPQALTVQAEPGRIDRAVDALGAGGLRVQRRVGNQLQVVADPARAAALSRLPGIAGARPATTAFADEVVPPAPGAALSQGLERTGANVLGRVADGGQGLVIAVLDLGFGANIATMQAKHELPPPSRLETAAFDTVNGLNGVNAYGNRTNHGEIVAQTVYDFAPKAHYLFVNYHSQADFEAAVDYLIARRPDIVVHSNSFIEGPFDGTGWAARAVDRAAAAGILWFNSAGNYALTHWAGPWRDEDGDLTLDWPNGNGWRFYRGAGAPITFALSWSSPPGGPPTDIDLFLDRLQPDGSWLPVIGSQDRQSEGAPTAERFTGYAPPSDGYYRLRAVHVSGPPPAGDLSLLSREIPLADIGGSAVGSIMTPSDAAGAIAVGATDWRGDRLKVYSSQGPTADGRLKPDLVAPTNTRVMGPAGLRGVGGTSNAAPNAAGAAAVMLAAARRAGEDPTPEQIRANLISSAVDLGAPGPDQLYGAGRVRVNLEAPRLTGLKPGVNGAVRARATVRFQAVARSRVTEWSLSVDGVRVARPQTYPRGITFDTRRLVDGWHLVRVDARDFSGNVATREWSVQVDNARPVLRPRRLVAGPRLRPGGAAPRRRAGMIVDLDDAGTVSALAVTAVVRPARGRARAPLTTRVPVGANRRVPFGTLPTGRYTVRLDVRDRAGNLTSATRRIIIR